jgi:hypothetical protein
MVREESSVMVGSRVKLTALKLAVLPAPSATTPLCQFAAVLQLPEPSKAQVPETAQACRVGTKRTAAKNSNGASERCTRLPKSRDERERIVFTGVEWFALECFRPASGFRSRLFYVKLWIRLRPLGFQPEAAVPSSCAAQTAGPHSRTSDHANPLARSTRIALPHQRQLCVRNGRPLERSLAVSAARDDSHLGLRVQILVVVLTHSCSLVRPDGFPIHVTRLPPAPFALRLNVIRAGRGFRNRGTHHGTLFVGRTARSRFRSRGTRRFCLRNCGSRSFRGRDRGRNRD